jgi:hypothetical protein
MSDFVRARKDYSGTAVIYKAIADRWSHVEGDYDLDLRSRTFKNETRLHKSSVNRRKIKRRQAALLDELIVIFGPEVWAEEAITLLRNLAGQIERRGLFIGYKDNGDEVYEVNS